MCIYTVCVYVHHTVYFRWQSAHFQSQWVIKPVCDISKRASYFVIDWQPVTILTQSLTFCPTCTPKSCFWPFHHLTHSDSQSLTLSIFSFIRVVLYLSLQIKPHKASLAALHYPICINSIKLTAFCVGFLLSLCLIQTLIVIVLILIVQLPF